MKSTMGVPKRLMLRLFTVFIISSVSMRLVHAQSTFNINLEAIRRSVVYLHVRDNLGQLKEAGTGVLAHRTN